MTKRVDRLREEIARLRLMARTSDAKAAADLRALADDMERVVSEMEGRNTKPESQSAE